MALIIDSEGNPEYEIKPDKETPLWNPHSQIIYYWTNDYIRWRYILIKTYEHTRGYLQR